MSRGAFLLVVCLGGSLQAQQSAEDGGGGSWGAGDNVLAAITHYGARIQQRDASADDFRHLSTALRFAGQLDECASVMRSGIMRVPEFATGANYFALANVLRASGRPREAAGAYQAAVVADPLAGNYYMQLGMTLQYHNVSGLGATRLDTLYRTAVRISAQGDEVWMQSKLLDVMFLLTRAQLGQLELGVEAINRYRQLIAVPDTAWLRWGHALGLPSELVVTYKQRAFSPAPRHHAEETQAYTGLAASLHAELEAVLDGLQFPPRCGDARGVIFRLENNIFGLGAQIHLLSLVASYAVATGRTLLAAEEDQWWYAGDSCPSGSLHCYFHPLSPCTFKGPNGVAADLHWKSLPLLGEHNEQADRLVVASVDSEHFLKSSGYRTFVPQRFARMGLLWWRTQLVARIFRPRNFVIEHARSVARRIPWPVPWDATRQLPSEGRGGARSVGATAAESGIVGVHVRHGDKVLEEAPRVPLARYVDKIRQAVKRIEAERALHPTWHVDGGGGGDVGVGVGRWRGKGRVFVSTDSQHVLEEIKALAPELEILAVWNEKR